MARSVWCGSLFLLASALIACGGGGDTTGKSTSGGGGQSSGSGPTTTGTTSSSGGGAATTATTGTGMGGAGTTSGTGGAGGATTGSGGAGGVMSTSSAGGAGGMGATSTSASTGGNVGDMDQDGDGWTPNQGDCCDVPGGCSDKPALVNPGAYEYPGNTIDDDCNPATPDNVLPTCSNSPLPSPTTGDDLVKAMDLCTFTTENPPLPQKTWGVISTAILTADGQQVQTPKQLQVGVLADYGSGVSPQLGATMAAISSGTARDPDDPGYVHPQNGIQAGQNGNYNAGTQTKAPADFLAAHGNNVPAGCGGACVGNTCTTAFDSVNLKARIRVPTNAKGFSYKLKFYTAEYPEYLCQQYNDFFVTLLDSQAAGLPADKNIAFAGLDQNNNPKLVSVNSAFLEVCMSQNGVTCTNQTELVGTGMGGWGNDLSDGGGTKWLTNEAPVVPGETMEIRFVIWDAADHNVDSLVLLDKFSWKIDAATVSIHK